MLGKLNHTQIER